MQQINTKCTEKFLEECDIFCRQHVLWKCMIPETPFMYDYRNATRAKSAFWAFFLPSKEAK